MSRIIENRAKEYLINDFKDGRYKFERRKKGEELGYDMWMVNRRDKKARIKIELKATTKKYERQSSLFERLYFSAKNEMDNFQKGQTKILRVFLGNDPPRIFLIDNSILNDNARFEIEYRAKIVGKKNYQFIKEM